MGCCGNKRSAAAQEYRQTTSDVNGVPAGQMRSQIEKEAVNFQYTGKTALSVQGIFSRRTYRFAHPGAVLAVDGRDAPSMKAVPLLKPVKRMPS